MLFDWADTYVLLIDAGSTGRCKHRKSRICTKKDSHAQDRDKTVGVDIRRGLGNQECH